MCPKRFSPEIKKTKSPLHLGCIHVFTPEDSYYLLYHKKHQIHCFYKESQNARLEGTPRTTWSRSQAGSLTEFWCLKHTEAQENEMHLPQPALVKLCMLIPTHFFLSYSSAFLVPLTIWFYWRLKSIHKAQQCSRFPMATQAVKRLAEVWRQ